MPNVTGSSAWEPPYVRVMGRISDRRIRPIERQRVRAIQRLRLRPGDRVIDAGCGNGGSFPYLLEQVGPKGEVVGIEVSGVMADRANSHVREHRWNNVTVIASSVEEAVLSGQFDGLLLFGAHEILTSPTALDVLFSHLRKQARVVAFGANRTSPPLGWLFNPILRVMSRAWLPTSPPIDDQPWRGLRERLANVTVETRVGGLMYLVSGLNQ